MGKKLFDPIVEDAKLHASFEMVRTAPPQHPGRAMMEEVFSEFDDLDGNFLEQFQTTGFDARCFELYVFALLKRGGYKLDRSHPIPDFIATRDGVTAAIEVTTVNPAREGPMSKVGLDPSKATQTELLDHDHNELPIRFGSPLFSKLQNKYWELEHCRGLPLVIVIQAFHMNEALSFSDSALMRYLYGVDQTGQWSETGELEITTERVASHAVPGKSIPSNFFLQPGSENISAVVFSNSGSLAKFDRMGFHHGYGNETFLLTREGISYNPNPDAKDPSYFRYDVGHPPFVESWAQGLVVNHNPGAKNPLPTKYFGPVVNTTLKDARIVSEVRDWHPISSRTFIRHVGDVKAMIPAALLADATVSVGAISKKEFAQLVGYSYGENPLFEEQGWFCDGTESFVGVVLYDKGDEDWGFVVLARDPLFAFRAIEVESSLDSRLTACALLQRKIASLLLAPKRIFVQDSREDGPTPDA